MEGPVHDHCGIKPTFDGMLSLSISMAQLLHIMISYIDILNHRSIKDGAVDITSSLCSSSLEARATGNIAALLFRGDMKLDSVRINPCCVDCFGILTFYNVYDRANVSGDS